MAVIRPEISTDPAELEQIAFDFLQEGFRGWVPHDGDLMTWLIGAHARMVAEERDIAADVPLEQILRPLGEEVHRILPRVATPATVEAVVELRDDRGYTIPEGTEVLVRTAGDDGVTMAVVEDRTVPPPTPGVPGITSADVRLRAIVGREGTIGNGLTSANEVVPIRPLEFIRSIRLTGTSGGGTDAETDEQYLQRLVDTLALTSPIPILPEDFAAIARQQPGVSRALAFNNSGPNEEVLTISTSSSWVLLTDGTSGESFRIDAGTSNADLERILAIYDARVEGGEIGWRPVTIRLRNRWQYGPWTLGPEGEDGRITVVERGGERAVLRERSIVVAVVGPDGNEVSTDTRDRVRRELEAMRELNWVIGVIDPTLNAIQVQFEAVAWPTYERELVQAAADQALRDYLSPARWGMGQGPGETPDSTVWVEERVVRYLEVAQVLNEVPGLRYVTNLRIAGEDRVFASDDVELEGIAPMPFVAPGRDGIDGEVAEG